MTAIISSIIHSRPGVKAVITFSKSPNSNTGGGSLSAPNLAGNSSVTQAWISSFSFSKTGKSSFKIRILKSESLIFSSHSPADSGYFMPISLRIAYRINAKKSEIESIRNTQSGTQ